MTQSVFPIFRDLAPMVKNSMPILVIDMAGAA